MVDQVPLNVAIAGTDTGVGKTMVTTLLSEGLREMGRRVWVHKPVACGDWADNQADDGRTFAALADPSQPPGSWCPRQYREAASPHLAAQAEGQSVLATDLLGSIPQPPEGVDLVVEGAGGVLAPLATDDTTILDLALTLNLPLVIVTRPHLGTLNHTCLTVEVARSRGVSILGLVLNYHEPVTSSLATDTAATELVRLTGLPLLADIAFAATDQAQSLAETVLAAHEARR